MIGLPVVMGWAVPSTNQKTNCTSRQYSPKKLPIHHVGPSIYRGRAGSGIV